MRDDFICEECAGTGMANPNCKACDGNGWVKDEKDGGTMTCPECDNEKCCECGGDGERPCDEAIEGEY